MLTTTLVKKSLPGHREQGEASYFIVLHEEIV